jgi:hypothetical protein
LGHEHLAKTKAQTQLDFQTHPMGQAFMPTRKQQQQQQSQQTGAGAHQTKPETQK